MPINTNSPKGSFMNTFFPQKRKAHQQLYNRPVDTFYEDEAKFDWSQEGGYPKWLDQYFNEMGVAPADRATSMPSKEFFDLKRMYKQMYQPSLMDMLMKAVGL